MVKEEQRTIQVRRLNGRGGASEEPIKTRLDSGMIKSAGEDYEALIEPEEIRRSPAAKYQQGI